MTHITRGLHDTSLWPRVTPLYPDGHVGVMMMGMGADATFYDQENADAWASVDSEHLIRDVAGNA